MRCRRLVLMLGLWGMVGGAQAKRALAAPAPTHDRAFTIRYILFAVENKPGFSAAQNVIQSIMMALVNDPKAGYKHPVSLGTDPEEFLAKLRQKLPGCEFRLQFAGTAVCKEKESCVLDGGPKKGDPFQLTFRHAISLQEDSPKTVRMQFRGVEHWSLPPAFRGKGQVPHTDAGAQTDESGLAPGRTYLTSSSGITSQTGPKRVLHFFSAICILAGTK